MKTAASEDRPAPGAEWWDREIFLSPDTPDSRCPEVIDVTGAARYLVYGPHRHLDLGVWRATAALELCPDAARRRLVLQLGALSEHSGVDLPVGVPGRHSIAVEHRVTEAGPAEVRLLLRIAGFHGEVRFFGAMLERISDL